MPTGVRVEVRFVIFTGIFSRFRNFQKFVLGFTGKPLEILAGINPSEGVRSK